MSRHLPYAGTSIVEVLGCDRANRGVRTRFVLPFEPLQRLTMLAAPRVVRPRRWRHLARQALARAVPSYDALRAAGPADIAILPFQLEPALAVSRGLASRILIADDVGLGKTIQAGLVVAEILARSDDPHVLVVVPAGLREQWAAELRSRYRLSPAILDAAALARASSASGLAANPWAAHPLIIVSADYVKRPEVMRSLETLVWDLAVFDEAHGLTGRSDRTAAAGALAERARTLLLLTATPHSGDDGAFARLCGIGDLNGDFPLAVFRRTRREVGLSSSRRTTWLRITPTVTERAMHRALLEYARLVWSQRSELAGAARLAMVVLARRACSSAGSLAASVERRLAHLEDGRPVMMQLGLPLWDASGDDDEPAAELAAPGLDDPADERARLERILNIARRAAHRESKLRAVRRLLRRTRESAIVFTEYRDTLAHLAAELRDVDTVQLHGGLSPSERSEALRQFTSGGARVLLATDAASEGLNLQQHCRLVINLELPWTPLRLEQRLGRVERIGQSKRVHAVHLVAADTSEEETIARLARRLERIRQVLAGLQAPVIHERDAAREVLGGEPVAEIDEPHRDALPPGVTLPDLRAAASAEATRVTLTRMLAVGSNDPASDTRPFVTMLRPRTRTPRSYWAFRLEFTDKDLRVIWDTVLGVAADVAAPRSDGIRSWIDACSDSLSPIVERERRVILDTLAGQMRAPLALAARRERAVMAAAAARHARIAATLLQPTLFDRRMERAAAAQRDALGDTLTRCTARLQALTACAQILPGKPELVFAVIAG